VEQPSAEEIEQQPHRDNFDWQLGVNRPSETARAFYRAELFVYEDKPRGGWCAKFRGRDHEGEEFATEPTEGATKGAAVAAAVAELLDAVENGEIKFEFFAV